MTRLPAISRPCPEAVGGIPLPATASAAAAYQVAAEFLGPELLGHSARTYVWAAHFAATAGVRYDEELLFVASMLHDVALGPSFDSHALPFEVAGGNVAVVFGHGARWPSGRRARAAEVIRLHMADDVGAHDDPEGFLIQAGVSADVSGRRVDELPPPLVAAALQAWPREGFGDAFAAAFRDQAARKPGCSAAEAVRGGIEGRIRRNRLDAP